MSEVLHANIFFIIASVASVIFFIIVCFVMYQIFKIVRIIRSILERIESASEIVAQDVTDLRASFKNGGWFGKLFEIILTATGVKSRSNRSRK